MLAINGLQVRYGAIVAVRDLSLSVAEGELVALVGANGAGKSTTMAAIAGVVKPSTGTITFLGQSLRGRSSEAIAGLGVALIPEDRGIFPSLTVEQNLRLGAYLRRGQKDLGKDFASVYRRFPILAERAKQGAGTLSGGEQQQLAIGRALLSRPKLLMLDEPSLGLSPTMVDRMFELIDELHRDGTTILLVEQNVRRTLEIVDRAYLLTNGRLTASGTPEQLRQEVDIAGAYMGGRAAAAGDISEGRTG
ncbi:ABC transporter ATP-binding protein [Sphaerimonospora mesophila]|uniref:ABC transporter ATP-binding protein n=1 Tax=Sphaerimonospora mesophila TaxID=37483 RepID=UPI0006E31068